MVYPATGFGQQSKYFDDDILFDGTYQIISVTLHADSTDDNNPKDTSILRPGLLLAKDPVHSGLYMPLSTADGYLNGDTPTQFMNDVVILGRKIFIDKTFILGMKRERDVDATNRVVPAYMSCNIKTEKVFYNNSAVTAITDDQWALCQRINIIPRAMRRFEESDTNVRALLWKRIETFVSPSDLV